MSTSNLRMLASRIPKVSLKGVAYLAAANFLARSVILIRHYIVNYFHSEMVLLYGATLDTRILLFFQSIYMIPMFLLGVLVFYGIERESFNLVLYPTLMLLFLILIRYGSETALLVIHWEDHKFNQTPELLFSLLQDVIFLSLLFLYVYVCLAFTPIKPTPLELVEGGNNGGMLSQSQQQQLPSTSQNNAYPADSQGFNYALRRNVGQIPKDSADKAVLIEIEQQKQRNSLLLTKEKEGGPVVGPSGSVIETDLDAVPTPAAVAVEAKTETAASDSKPEPAEPVVTIKLPKKPKIVALTKKPSTESPPAPAEEPENPVAAEPEADFWSSMNGDGEDSKAKTESFKTTSV